MEQKTQNEIILEHLSDYGSITNMEAATEYGIMRLASRIYDLRKLGYPIVGEDEFGFNRYGKLTRYSRYRLEN